MLKTKLEKCEEEKIRNKEKIRALQDVVTSREKKIEDLEYNLEESTQIVTSNYNKIQVLENSNTDLKNNLEETTEKLNDVKSKLNFQFDLRQKGYDEYQVKLASMNTTINCLESSLKEAKEKKLEETAGKDEKIKALEMLNDESEAKLEKMKNEYMVDISSKNDLLERLDKSV